MASFIQHAFIICRTLKELTNSAFSIVFSFFPFQIHFLPRNWIASTHACARFIRFIKKAERKKLRLTKKSSSGSLIQFWLNAGENPYSDVLLIENINIFSSARSWLVCSSLLLMFHWKCERTSYVRFFFLLLRALTSGLVKKKKKNIRNPTHFRIIFFFSFGRKLFFEERTPLGCRWSFVAVCRGYNGFVENKIFPMEKVGSFFAGRYLIGKMIF